MSGRRVALVARRFWPLVGETEMAIADLAVALQRVGHRPKVVTARWNKIWPQSFAYEDVPVVRIAGSPTGMWATWRYQRQLERWLRDHCSDLDAVLVAGLQHDAMAAVGSLERATVPVVLLADERDVLWHKGTRLGGLIRRRCQRAGAFVVPDEISRAAMSAAGFADQRLHIIPPGVPIPQPVGSDARRQARQALARAMGGTVFSPLTPLAIGIVALEANPEVVSLLAAWRQVVAQWPDAHLWLLGEGPGRMALFELIERLDLVGRVLMPGWPESLDDLLAAADMYVAPCSGGPASRFLLMAMAAGLPVIASDTPPHRQMITNNQTGLLFASGDADDAAVAVSRALRQPTLARALGENGRNRCVGEYSIEHHTGRLVELIERLEPH